MTYCNVFNENRYCLKYYNIYVDVMKHDVQTHETLHSYSQNYLYLTFVELQFRFKQ